MNSYFNIGDKFVITKDNSLYSLTKKGDIGIINKINLDNKSHLGVKFHKKTFGVDIWIIDKNDMQLLDKSKLINHPLTSIFK